MRTRDVSLEDLRPLLKRKMSEQDVAAESEMILDEEVRRGWNRLRSSIQDGDEVWEWEWFAEPQAVGLNSYSLGWCVVREGKIVDSYCHSAS